MTEVQGKKSLTL